MKIEKKTWPASFQAILNGEKKFDVRLGDVDFKPGDIIVLKEWDPEKGEFTGRTIEKEVGYVAKTKLMPYWSQEEIDLYGFSVVSFI